jgi:uncharacterized protein
MRLGGRRTSSNVSRGAPARGGGGFGFGGGGRGGGGGGLLFALVFSRFGIGGVVVLFILMFLLGGDPLGLSGQGGQGVAPHQASRSARGGGESAEAICASDPAIRFSCQVLASTEERWGEMFAAAGRRYEPPQLVVYESDVASGCGDAQAAMGPFYCPSSRSIYLDHGFFQELAARHGAPGDFAQAYVIGHEVGHHVQHLLGTADAVRRAQARASRTEANRLQVGMELQADCYAGVWAARERGAMEPGDLEEGMRAAEAIGDDRLQRAAGRRVAPETFTHGSSAQRRDALLTGFRGGAPEACAHYVG